MSYIISVCLVVVFQSILMADNEESAFIEMSYRDAIVQGVRLQNCGRHEEAIEIYGRCIEAFPSGYYAYANRANVFRVLGRYGEAEVDYNRAIEFGAKDERVYFFRGLVYYKTGRFGQAIKDYSLVVEMHGECRRDALKIMAVIQTEQGDLNSAIEVLRLVGEYSPEQSWATTFHVQLLCDKGDYENAIRLVDKCISEDYRDRQYVWGLPYYLSGNLSEAIEKWTLVLNKSQDIETKRKVYFLLCISSLKAGLTVPDHAEIIASVPFEGYEKILVECLNDLSQVKKLKKSNIAEMSPDVLYYFGELYKNCGDTALSEECFLAAKAKLKPSHYCYSLVIAALNKTSRPEKGTPSPEKEP